MYMKQKALLRAMLKQYKYYKQYMEKMEQEAMELEEELKKLQLKLK